MHITSGSRVIDAPLEAVWDVLDDYGNLQKYAPLNETCRLLDGPETGIGARRETTLIYGFTVVHEIIEYEPEKRYKFDFLKVGEFPMKEVQIGFGLEAIDDQSTEVTMTEYFVPKWGPIGWVLAKTILPRKNAEMREVTLKGLEKHIQTGEPIGMDAIPQEVPQV